MIDFEIERLTEPCAAFGVVLTQETVLRLNRYGNLLLSWNEKMNLTAITEPQEVLYKHFYDCLLLLKHIRPKKEARVIDVGTGAGFPGMVLKIARPDLEITLLDSLNKRLSFLNCVITELGLTGIQTVHLRAEDGGRNPLYREQYDIACARAVAALPVLLEYCVPFVKRGGDFVAMKGPSAAEELAHCEKAGRLLGVGQPSILCETLTGNEQRSFILFKKISQTPPKYPRNAANIAKQPL